MGDSAVGVVDGAHGVWVVWVGVVVFLVAAWLVGGVSVRAGSSQPPRPPVPAEVWSDSGSVAFSSR